MAPYHLALAPLVVKDDGSLPVGIDHAEVVMHRDTAGVDRAHSLYLLEGSWSLFGGFFDGVGIEVVARYVVYAVMQPAPTNFAKGVFDFSWLGRARHPVVNPRLDVVIVQARVHEPVNHEVEPAVAPFARRRALRQTQVTWMVFLRVDHFLVS